MSAASRTALVIATAVLLARASAPLLAETSATGTIQNYKIDAPSLNDKERSVHVYLPPSYAGAEAANQRYPTVYLLHGWPGSDGNWLKMGKARETLDRLIAAARIPEVIAVFPDGRGRGLFGRSLYIDSYDGSSRVEQFITHDLVSWVDSTFRTERVADRRAVIGLSDGGTGAFNLAIRHPDLFRAAASHSGEFLLEKELGMGGILGPEPGARELLEANSPELEAAHATGVLRGDALYFDCGTDDDALADNQQFHHTLDSLGVAHTFREFPGTHDWEYWRTHLEESLEAVTAAMR